MKIVFDSNIFISAIKRIQRDKGYKLKGIFELKVTNNSGMISGNTTLNFGNSYSSFEQYML